MRTLDQMEGDNDYYPTQNLERVVNAASRADAVALRIVYQDGTTVTVELHEFAEFDHRTQQVLLYDDADDACGTPISEGVTTPLNLFKIERIERIYK